MTRAHAAPLLTNRATAVLAEAVQESRRLFHGSVGTEHVLMALLDEGGPAPAALQSLGIDIEQLSATVRNRARAEPTVRSAMPLLLRIRPMLQLAEAEARRLRQPLGPEHLLLGLIAAPKGLGPELLREAGITLEATRRALEAA